MVCALEGPGSKIDPDKFSRVLLGHPCHIHLYAPFRRISYQSCIRYMQFVRRDLTIKMCLNTTPVFRSRS